MDIRHLQKIWRWKGLLAAELPILALLVHQTLALASLFPLNWVLNSSNKKIEQKTNDEKTSGGGHNFDPPAASRSPHVSRISETDLENSVLSMSETLSARTCGKSFLKKQIIVGEAFYLLKPRRPHCRCRPTHPVLSGISTHDKAAGDK